MGKLDDLISGAPQKKTSALDSLISAPKERYAHSPSGGMGALRQVEASAPSVEPRLVSPPKTTFKEQLIRPVQAFKAGVDEGIAPTLINKGLRKADEALGIANATHKPAFDPKGLENIPYFLGRVIGDLPTVLAAYATGGAGATMALSRVAPVAPKVLTNPVTQELVRGLGAGATHGTMRSAVEGQPIEQAVKTIGTEAAMFGIGDPAFGTAGRLIKKALAKPKPPVPAMEPEAKPLLLPEFTTDVGAIRQRGISGGVPLLSGSVPKLSKPTPTRLKLVDYTQRAMDELQAGIQEVQNYVRHNDILAAFPPGTTVEQAYTKIKADTGIDLPQLMANVEKAMTRPGLRQTAIRQGQYANLRKAAGLMPETLGRTGRFPRKLGEVKTVPIQPKLTLPTAELEAARNILKTTKNPARIQKIMEVYPELRAEFPKLVKQIEKQAAPPKVKSQGVKAGTVPQQPPVDNGKLFSGDVSKLKDIGGWRLQNTDVYRNFADVFGKQFKEVKKKILDPFDRSKVQKVEFEKNLLTNLKENVVDRLGIKKGSKLSALVQRYGEGNITLEQLKQQHPNDWQKVVEADKWFRQTYDKLIDQVNTVRAQIYPNNPDKLVPKRKNYYRHFREMAEGFKALHNIFDSPAQIDPTLVGISEFTLPKSKWASFMQKRKMGPYTEDAVGGFIDYLPAASYSIHIDPHIGKFEGLAKELAEATIESRKVNNFIEYLQNFAQDLAGKTNPADRYIQKIIPGGRATFRALDWVNNRIKSNTILGNLRSLIAQVFNIPNGIAFAKQHTIPGIGRAMLSIFDKNAPIYKSGFIKERFAGKMYREFNINWVEGLTNNKVLGKAGNLLSPTKAKDFAVWLMETSDRVGTSVIWNSVYSKALAQGVKNPVKYADDITRKLVAGRGIGEVPLIQKSRLYQWAFPFQLEVANLWSVMRDFVKAKDFGALATLFVANYLFNRVAEEITGNGVTFDPIKAIEEALQEDNRIKQGGRLLGEVLSNVPGGQTLATIYPEYGFEIMGYKLPTRKEFFGREDPTRFGSGILAAKAIQDPLFKLLPPFAGGQIKKTIEGQKAIKSGGIYTEDGTKLKYPIDITGGNRVKGLLFGPSGFNESKTYYDNNRRPLTELQTEQLKRQGNPKSLYNQMQFKRELESIDRQIDEVKKDKKLSQEEKAKKVQELIRKRQALLQRGAV